MTGIFSAEAEQMSLSPEVESHSTPVVFLHGWGGSAAGTWLASGLPQRFQQAGRRSLIVDLPGHGARSRLLGASHDPSDYDGIVDQVQASLPAGSPIDLVGFSLGAKIALLIASRGEVSVRRVVAAGVGGNIFRPEPGGAALSSVLRGGIAADVSPKTRRSAVYALQSGGDPLAMAACVTRQWTPPTAAQLAAIDARVLLAVGDEDDIVGGVQALANHLAKAVVHRLPGIDHFATPYARELHELTIDFLT